ncbi:MAG TPA: M20/M25/M40 family metallo-hydrolase [Solirubrobacterales bacterium]|nr:M20/M25/M40 family metallo-hydrolase [Solirubrobacterales bacterium]
MTAVSAEWLSRAGAEIAHHAERELEALVAISSPSGDVEAAEEICSLLAALVPAEARIERLECSTPGFGHDFLATLTGTGERRVLLLGHVDTVIAHRDHQHLRAEDGRLVGSGSIDMKGGIALALGVMRAVAAVRDAFAEFALLAVVDEEWRAGGFGHTSRFAGFDACLCFEAAQLGPGGEEAVIARRKAASTLRVVARGVAAHSGSAPERGRNALLALGEAARRVVSLSAPAGPNRLTAVPTVIEAGEAFNVVPAHGELTCDLRADSLDAFAPVVEAVPADVDGVALEAELVRHWPGMDTRERVADRLLAPAVAILGRPILAGERGGASDASHMAPHIALTVDGLGPRGGHAHHPDEFVLAESLLPRAEIALAVTAAALGLI